MADLHVMALKHIRFDDVGFKLEIGADTGKMDADIFSGEDRLGRYVHIERDEHSTYIYRERLGTDQKVRKGDWELFDIVANGHCKVSNPTSGDARPPLRAPDRKPKDAPAAAPVVKLGQGR